MSRFVIRNAAGLLYTGNAVETTYRVSPTDPTRNVEHFILTPAFLTLDVQQALHYDSHADADAVMAHPDLAAPNAFAGCEVLECEFEREDTQATRPSA
jgi:hypothetical protein